MIALAYIAAGLVAFGAGLLVFELLDMIEDDDA